MLQLCILLSVYGDSVGWVSRESATIIVWRNCLHYRRFSFDDVGLCYLFCSSKYPQLATRRITIINVPIKAHRNDIPLSLNWNVENCIFFYFFSFFFITFSFFNFSILNRRLRIPMWIRSFYWTQPYFICGCSEGKCSQNASIYTCMRYLSENGENGI